MNSEKPIIIFIKNIETLEIFYKTFEIAIFMSFLNSKNNNFSIFKILKIKYNKSAIDI